MFLNLNFVFGRGFADYAINDLYFNAVDRHDYGSYVIGD
jgi:hypothetical protein